MLLLAIWAVAFGFVCQALAGGRRVFTVVAALVVSHWVLDFVTHRPDLPLYPGGPKLGLGLWSSIPGTMAVELALYAAGVWVYLRATRAKDTIGRWAFPGLAAFLVLLYFGNLAGAPPSVTALYISAILGASLLTLWSWWADRHRESVEA